MFKVIKYEDIDKNKIKESYILIDVRSPYEYRTEMIPGSINVPIFNDDERKLIGTIYTQESTEKAKKIGVEIVASKLPELYEEFSEIHKEYNKLILFCARGGFRSSSLVSLFGTLGTNIYKLDKGYKGYRKYINDNLPETMKKVKFIVLYGNTGIGKTDILKALKDKGKDALDLEGCANHRGSIFGGVGLGNQSTQKVFESLVYESLRNRKTDLVFVEGESRKIGKVAIPEYIYETMDEGINLCIDADLETRIDNVLRDYVHGTDDELKESLSFLRKQLGHKTINKYIGMIDKDEYREIIKELMVNHYDPHYEHKNRKYIKIFKNSDSQITAGDIIGWLGDFNNENMEPTKTITLKSLYHTDQ